VGVKKRGRGGEKVRGKRGMEWEEEGSDGGGEEWRK
jgi:hypothetical protein